MGTSLVLWFYMATDHRQRGRPPKLTDEQRAEVLQAFSDYIKRTPDPIIVGFCVWDPVAEKYNVTDDDIYNWSSFNGLRKRAVMKQEAYLATGAATNKLNATMAIFRLKQPTHGYTDRQLVDQVVTTVTPILGGNSKKPNEA